MSKYFGDNNDHDYPEPPPFAEFSEWLIHDGTQWDGTNRNASNDNSCVAVAKHDNGAVLLADTKLDLSDQTPLYFTGNEWRKFKAALVDGRL